MTPTARTASGLIRSRAPMTARLSKRKLRPYRSHTLRLDVRIRNSAHWRKCSTTMTSAAHGRANCSRGTHNRKADPLRTQKALQDVAEMKTIAANFANEYECIKMQTVKIRALRVASRLFLRTPKTFSSSWAAYPGGSHLHHWRQRWLVCYWSG